MGSIKRFLESLTDEGKAKKNITKHSTIPNKSKQHNLPSHKQTSTVKRP